MGQGLEGHVAIMDTPTNILGMDWIPGLLPDWCWYKKLKFCHSVKSCSLPTVSISPVEISHILPSFTKQYPLKGGHKEITKTIEKLLKEGIIERAQSFNLDSPVWLVRKPIGDWRLTLDFTNTNKLSPQMPGQLAEVKAIFNELQNFNPTVFATTDLSDMFLAIPLHENNTEITTFTWNAKQYRFTRVPQGYRKSPIFAHTALQDALPLEDIPPSVKVLSYVDIIIAEQSDAEVDKVKNLVISTLTKAGWTINPDKDKAQPIL